MTPKILTIHCAASPNGRPYPIEQIKKDHVARGFTTVGYHFVIQPDGTLNVGRPVAEVGAHVEGHNTGNVGICLVGMNRYTPSQWDSLWHLLDQLSKAYEIPVDCIHGHYEFDTAKKQGKTCPNVPIEVIRHWFETQETEGLNPYILRGEDHAG